MLKTTRSLIIHMHAHTHTHTKLDFPFFPKLMSWRIKICISCSGCCSIIQCTRKWISSTLAIGAMLMFDLIGKLWWNKQTKLEGETERERERLSQAYNDITFDDGISCDNLKNRGHSRWYAVFPLRKLSPHSSRWIKNHLIFMDIIVEKRPYSFFLLFSSRESHCCCN